MRVLTLKQSCSIIKGMIDAKMLPAEIEYPIELANTGKALRVVSLGSEEVWYLPLTGRDVLV